jgi:hypothetical protein
VRGAAVPGVFTFGILADYHPIEVSAGAGSERGGSATEDPGRANIGVLLEGLADGETEAPE